MSKTGANYIKNRYTLFKLLFDSLFFNYSDFFGKYSMNILDVLLLCDKFPNRELSFLSLKYLCSYLGDDPKLFSAIPDITLFINKTIESIPDLISYNRGSVIVVDIIEKILQHCGDSEKRNFLISILYKISDEFSDSSSCASMQLIYKTFHDSNNYDEIITFIKKPFLKGCRRGLNKVNMNSGVIH